MLLFALQFTWQDRHIIFSFAPFPNSKAAALLCSALGSCSLWDYWVQFQWNPQLKDTVKCWALIISSSKLVHSCSGCTKPLYVMRDPIILPGFLPNSPIELFCVFSLENTWLERNTWLLLLETQGQQERLKQLNVWKTLRSSPLSNPSKPGKYEGT